MKPLVIILAILAVVSTSVLANMIVNLDREKRIEKIEAKVKQSAERILYLRGRVDEDSLKIFLLKCQIDGGKPVVPNDEPPYCEKPKPKGQEV